MRSAKAATILLAATVWFCSGGAVFAADRGVTVKQLRCEYLENPVGIDVAKPRLSWILESRKRGLMQSAYQILVASSEKKLKKDQGDLWDTGKVASEQSIHVVYGGPKLASRTRCWWKVRVWGPGGEASAYSAVASWEMGLLARKDWQGKWLSAAPPEGGAGFAPSPLFRKAFGLKKTVKKARAYICGLGYYELYINGKKVGDHVLDPAFTRYDLRALYVTYDVTEQVKRGKNAVGVILGNGWYNQHTPDIWGFQKAFWRDRPTVLCQIEVAYTDGSSEVISTDATWKVSTGPIVFESIRNGETYDARLEKPGWSTAGYDDSAWARPVVVAGPKGKLSAQMLPPIRVTKSITPVKVTQPKAGCFVFDLGQNIAGWAKIRVKGPAGTKVVMKYSERLKRDGTIDQAHNRQYVYKYDFQTDTYILKGRGVEIWEPRFSYHGFQYVQVTGFPGTPTVRDLLGRVIHTSFERAGSFECSNELLNKIQQNTLWSFIGNYHGYPTDCPHREKNGWTADAHLAAEIGLYNFDSASAYTKWLIDIRDEYEQSKRLPGMVPTANHGWGNYVWGPPWDSVYILVPWYLYQYRGDVRILEEHYDGMKRYVDSLKRGSKNLIVTKTRWDWAPAKSKTAAPLTATAYFYSNSMIVSQAAKLLGKDADAKKYADLALNVKDAFNSKFYEPATGLYTGGTQTGLSSALYHGLVEPENREKVLGNLVDNIKRNNGHLDVGILGAKYLLHALTDGGRGDVAYKVATKRTQPSWGWWVSEGATTLWELWNGKQSRNHVFFGEISVWYYKALAGINIDPDRPAFKHIIIRPHLLGDLRWVRAEHASMYGLIKSSWRIEGKKFTLEVTLPANTTGTVHVPAADAKGVTEGTKPAGEARGVKFLRMEGGAAVFAVGSGKYRFASRLPR
ncbi:MAG: glycoside hydrolase family 78 protein [Planctomycetia bacterium]|nr:glycoside hydrolase family 78 protein [Planctomycetia bacterium]